MRLSLVTVMLVVVSSILSLYFHCLTVTLWSYRRPTNMSVSAACRLPLDRWWKDAATPSFESQYYSLQSVLFLQTSRQDLSCSNEVLECNCMCHMLHLASSDQVCRLAGSSDTFYEWRTADRIPMNISSIDRSVTCDIDRDRTEEWHDIFESK